MKEGQEIGKMSFEFDGNQIGEIVAAGKLNAFIEKATELFRQNLKAELVSNVSSGAISLAHVSSIEGDIFLTGPRGPIHYVFKELERIERKMEALNSVVHREVVFNNPTANRIPKE